MHTIPRVVAVATWIATSIATLPAFSAPSAPAAAPTCPALADAISREHPALRAAKARARAATERSGAERSLPPPSVSFEIWDFPIGAPSHADEEGMYMLGVAQEFPGGGRSDRARADEEEARAESAMGADVARLVRADVARACVAWSVAETVRVRLVEYRKQLEQVRDAALVGYRGSAGRLGDVARAEAEIAGAERRIGEAEAEAETARTTLEALAGGVRLPKEAPALSEKDFDPDVRSLTTEALATRGDVGAARARQGAAAARAEAADSEASTPSFMVKTTYMQTPGMRAGLGAMVSMSLPWLWGGGGGRRDSANHEIEAAGAEAESARRMARVEVARAAGRLRALHRSLALLREREIPAAERAVEAERAGLGSGSFDLAAWIQAASALRMAEVEEARMQGEIEQALVELEASVGRPLDGTKRDGGRAKP